MVRTWTKGKYDIDKIIQALTKLDKVTADKGHAAFYLDDGEPTVAPESYFGGEDDISDGEIEPAYVYVYKTDQLLRTPQRSSELLRAPQSSSSCGGMPKPLC